MVKERQLKDKTLYIGKKNETYLEVFAEDAVMASLSDFFSFFVPGYQYMPKFRMKMWDGKLRLFNRLTNEIYVGLLPHIIEYAHLHEYEVEFLDQDLDVENEFSVVEAENFAKSLDIHAKHDGAFKSIEAHDYQIAAFRHAVQSKRCLLLSPTASGKSLIIYLLVRYYQKVIESDRKILIVVPTTSLVGQLFNDFGEYSYALNDWDVRDKAHMVYEGQDKGSEKQIIISTWQSIYKLGQHYFDQFDVIIGDEAHSFKADSLTSIMKKSTKAEFRIGTTGTLDGTKTHKLVLEGLFGKVYQVTSTKELMDRGTVSDMKINCLMLHYPPEVCKVMKSKTYQEEIDFLVSNEKRNKFIRNLALSLKGNTLVLFQLVKKHGKPLYENIKAHAEEGRKVFWVAGEVEAEARECIRKITETETNAIIVASYGTFSTGINIRNLPNIILSAPSKSRIRILQSLGRGLRKSVGKEMLNVYDLSDSLQHKSHRNHTLKHFVKRVEIYNSEKFDYKIYKVQLKA